MKKLTTLCAALLFAATSFAAVEYVLPEGAVTNDYGWTSKGAMLYDFQTELNTFASKSFNWVKLEDGQYLYKVAAEDVWEDEFTAITKKYAYGITGFIQATSYPGDFFKSFIESNETSKAKYGWFTELFMVEGNKVADNKYTDVAAATYRSMLSGFFLNSPSASAYPVCADFTQYGKFENFAPYWKHGFDNPTEVAEGKTWTLNAPYKEGESFRGWFTNPEGSGEAVTTIDHTTTGKLYACFGAYIPTIKEVLALEQGVETLAKGTVTFVNGNQFYMQDATGAIQAYQKDLKDEEGNAVTLVEGEEVLLTAKLSENKGMLQLSDVTVKSHVAATPIDPAAKLLSDFKDDVLYQLVKVQGLKVAEYRVSGSYTNVCVTDGTATVQAHYKYGMTAETHPVGTKIVLTGVITKSGEEWQIAGKPEWLEAAATAAKDAYEYPARGENGEYTMTNLWTIDALHGNYDDNVPGPAAFVRGMAALNGKMYFPNRSTMALTVVDGKTGAMLDPIPLKGEHLFEVQGPDGAWSSAGSSLPFNDLKVDNAGNMLTFGAVNSRYFQVYKINPETGETTIVIDEDMQANPDLGLVENDVQKAVRFDAFGVYGDVNSHAVVMAMVASGSADDLLWTAFRWEINDGKAEAGTLVSLSVNLNTDNTLLVTGTGDNKKLLPNFGVAPQIFPISDNLFYVDGQSTRPTLFSYDDTEGSAFFADDFAANTSLLKVGNNEGDSIEVKANNNGLAEFQIGDDYYMVMAATTFNETPANSFALYKFKNANKIFAEMEPMWFFPNDGLSVANDGLHKNDNFTAVPSVEVDQKTGLATIYIFAAKTGYAVYEFQGVPKVEDGIESVEAQTNNVRKVMRNGQIYIIKDGVEYNVLGVQVK